MPTYHFKIRRSFNRNGKGGYWAYFDLSALDVYAAYEKAREQSRGFSAGYVEGPFVITLEEYTHATRKPEPSRSTSLPPRPSR